MVGLGLVDGAEDEGRRRLESVGRRGARSVPGEGVRAARFRPRSAARRGVRPAHRLSPRPVVVGGGGGDLGEEVRGQRVRADDKSSGLKVDARGGVGSSVLALGRVETLDVPARPWTFAACVRTPCAPLHAVPHVGQGQSPRG